MNLADAPDCVFDFVNEFIEKYGEYPCYMDFEYEFGNKYPEWSERMPDTRYTIDDGVDDEEFLPQSTHDQMRDCGHKLSDFE